MTTSAQPSAAKLGPQCGLCWAFWTIVFTAGTFAEPGFGHVICLVLAVLSGLYDWRIWTKRAKRLSWLIIF